MSNSAKIRRMLDKGYDVETIAKKLKVNKELIYVVRSNLKKPFAKIVKVKAKKPSKIVTAVRKTKAELTAIEAKAAGDKLVGKDVGGLTLTKPSKDTYRWVRTDLVNNPPHYTTGGIDFLDFAEAKGLTENAYLFNVVKYVTRAGKKAGADPIEDLKKAEFYLKREIATRERA